MSDEPTTEPAPPMPPEPTLTDVMAIVSSTQAMIAEVLSMLSGVDVKVDRNAQAVVQLKNRVVEFHESASHDAAGVRSRLSVVEHRLGITPAPHQNGSPAE